MDTGKLYIVATPIGNLEDISQRAISTLKLVDYILCEDTRVTKKLLERYDIEAKLISYNQHSFNNPQKLEHIRDLLSAGSKLALVTDAGSPGVSDPGNELIGYLLRHSELGSESYKSSMISDPGSESGMTSGQGGAVIIPIPGPSAATTAISVCGFDMSRYSFIGFIPKKKKLKLIKSLTNLDWPFIYFDSPHRLVKNLQIIMDELGDRQVFVGRELTKLHEEHFRGSISDVLEKLSDANPKGEVVIIVSN